MDKLETPDINLSQRRHREMEARGYKLFTAEAQLSTTHTEKIIAETGEMERTGTKRLVAVIGNRFMNGGFLSADVLEKCCKGWENSLHDINHMGTNTGFFLMQSDITYFVGYHDNVKFNAETKEVSMELHIHSKTKFAPAWEGFVELCELAGQIPNVSVTYYGKQKYLPTSELPPEANWEAAGFKEDDLVPVLYDVVPVCVSTVLEGRCNDKDGCGIRTTDSYDGDKDEINAEIEKKRQELIEQIRLKEKELEDKHD